MHSFYLHENAFRMYRHSTLALSFQKRLEYYEFMQKKIFASNSYFFSEILQKMYEFCSGILYTEKHVWENKHFLKKCICREFKFLSEIYKQKIIMQKSKKKFLQASIQRK